MNLEHKLGKSRRVFALSTALAMCLPMHAHAAVLSNPDWVQAPTAEQIGAEYPASAAGLGVEDDVTLRCDIAYDGGMYSCWVMKDLKPQLGFSAAAKRLSQFYKISREQFNSLTGAAPAVNLRIEFKIADVAAYRQAAPQPAPLPPAPSYVQAQNVSSSQFDLLCNGRTEFVTGKEEPARMHLRMDMRRGVYCDDEACSLVKPMIILPTSIDFQPNQPEPGVYMSMTIDRTTKILTISGRSIGGSTNGVTLGTTTVKCDVAPFSGMPGNQF